MRRIIIGLATVVLGSASSAWADETDRRPVEAGEAESAKGGAERDLDARVSRLLAMARQAFEARDYEASRRLAYAACELRPSNDEAQDLHRLSIKYARRLRAAARVGGVRQSSESVEHAIDRLSGSRTIPWHQAPRGSGILPGEPAAVPVPEWEQRLEKRMAEKGTVSFQGDRFSVVKEYFEGLLACPIVVDRRLRDRVMELPVRFQAKDMPIEQIFRWVVENELGLRFAPVDGAIYLSDADGICEKAGVVEVYDVEDLLVESEMPDFVGPPLGLPAGPGIMGLQLPQDPETAPVRRHGLTPEQLLRMIERGVEPGTWKRDDQ